MQCPVCNVELKMSDRQAIEIDYCPRCRGVWLDRGELDKIVERSAAYEREVQHPRPMQSERKRRDEPRADYEYDDDSRDSRGKRKRSFLSEVFDILE
jgi:Zn-finger nucleic acid-binding protein